MQKKHGLAPPRGPDPEEVHPDAVFLSLLHANPEVFIAGKKHALSHRVIASQGEHVRDNQRVDSLLLPPLIHQAKANLDSRLVCKRDVLRRRTLRGAVVPVDSE